MKRLAVLIIVLLISCTLIAAQHQAPAFEQVWSHHAWWIVTMIALLLLLAVTSVGLVIMVRRSRRSLRGLSQMAENRQRILASLSEGVYGIDTEGRCIFINPAALQILGLREEQVIGQDTHPLFHAHKEEDGSASVESCPVHQAMHDGVKRETEDQFRRADGTAFPVSLGISAIRHAEGILGAVVVFQDISERKRIAEELDRYHHHLEEIVQERTEELRLARDAAEAANKAKSVFLANMSHELRTPLNAILGFSQLMRKDKGISASQIESLDIINNSGTHLLKLINDVLEIAKIEAGKLQLEIFTFDLHEMVREVTDMMQMRAEQKGLQLELDQSSEFPRYIKGDEARLRQILVNLVSNAVKFTDQGGVIVRLGVKDNAQHHLLIEVEDSGPGISEEDQQRLFKPFVQLASGMAEGGTGLGLSIVRQFVQLMEGVVTVESAAGKGTLFRVKLPLEEAEETEVIRLGSEISGDVAGLQPGQPAYRILIAEDQRDNQLLLSKLMNDLGLEVQVAVNGEVCVEMFKQWKPDLIWMDRRMPILDGEEAARQIRKLPDGDKVKIVAVTASAFREERERMLAAGIDDVVRKPYRFKEIYDSLARQLKVKYIYHDDEPASKASFERLSAQSLTNIPSKLRDELCAAVNSLDPERITMAVNAIRALDTSLGEVLSALVKDFDYPSILKLFGSGKIGDK